MTRRERRCEDNADTITILAMLSIWIGPIAVGFDAEHAHHRDRQDHRREGDEDVEDAHDQFVEERARPVSGDRAERHAEQDTDEHREESDFDRYPRAIDDAGEHVAPDVIGAKGMGERRRRQRMVRVGLVRDRER